MLSPEEYRAVAIVDLFGKYRNDPPFRANLMVLADDLRPVAPDLTPLRGHTFVTVEDRAKTDDRLSPYVDAVRTFAERWGLDRVDGMTGIDAVHRWLLYEEWTREEDEASEDPDDRANEDGGSFGFGVSLESFYLNVDATVHVGDSLEWDPEEEPRADSETRIPNHLQAFYRDSKTGVLPMHRPTTGVRTRIMKDLEPEQAADLDAELDRIQGEYDATGWVFPTTKTEYATHLRWTFERLAFRRAVADIAADADTTEKYCRERIDAMKQWLGIDRFPKANRKTGPLHRG